MSDRELNEGAARVKEPRGEVGFLGMANEQMAKARAEAEENLREETASATEKYQVVCYEIVMPPSWDTENWERVNLKLLYLSPELPPTTGSATFRDLSPGTTYLLGVRAGNSVGWSKWAFTVTSTLDQETA